MATRVQAEVVGSKMDVSTIPICPVLRPPYPPTTSTRPSGSSAIPEQKMLSGAVWVVNVCVLGFHTCVGSGCCQPSHCKTFPLSRSTEWIETIGQLMSADHCPPLSAVGVTGVDGAEARPVPTPLVAVTVNV